MNLLGRLGLVLAAAIALLMLASGPVEAAAPSAPVGQDEAPTPNPFVDTTNILVLGADREPGWPNWRTDVIMIVALDAAAGEAGVISLPRDLFLEEIPNHNPNRINVVDYLGEQDEPGGGGPALLGSLIEEHMGIPIDHYVRFDFNSFQEVVDALGGVEVEVDCPFTGYLRDYGGWLRLEPGVHNLSGNQALIYVRDRQLSGGDLDRARRQQRFVWSVRNQVISKDMVRRLPALYSALSDSVDTDLSLINTLRIAKVAVDLDLEDIHGFVVVPPEMVTEGWRYGMSVFIPDWEVIEAAAAGVFEGEAFDLTSTPEWCQ
jgi:LCP family protein required for cell wall assembly